MAFSARGEETLRATEREVAALGAQVLAVQADMTNTEEVEQFVNKTVERFGSVDILVNNVGGSRGGQTWDTSDEDWAEALYLNLFAAVRDLPPGDSAHAQTRLGPYHQHYVDIWP